MNNSILTAIESLCDDIATNTNPEDNKKRAEAAAMLAVAGIFTPEEYSDEYEDNHNEEEYQAAPNRKVPAAGTHFTYRGIEFVALGEEQGGVLAVVAKRLESKIPFDENNRNDWRGSTLQEYLNGEYLENFNKGDLLPFVSDLTSDDGMTDYGTSEDYIALLSDNLYRKYRKLIPKYDTWVWTITPWSCLPGNADHERTVNTSGALYHSFASNATGVAPACIFNLSIFE